MSDGLPQQCTFWGLRKPELRVLLVITHYFNGKTLSIRGEDRQLATHSELPLEELFLGSQWEYANHEHAHERLLNNGLLEETYISRRKIDWAPTQQGRQAIRECMYPWADSLRPEWADDEDDGPLFGDPNEGILHRKGVEIAGYELPKMAWAWDITKPRNPKYGVEWYPDDDRGEACHDLHIDTTEHQRDIGVEVITASNNFDYLVDKWERFNREDRVTLWIFDNRETACRLWNELDYRGLYHLDGQFRGVENWAATSINRKIWRSAKTYRDEPPADLIHTITGLLEGDSDTIQSLFESYYSTK